MSFKKSEELFLQNTQTYSLDLLTTGRRESEKVALKGVGGELKTPCQFTIQLLVY